MELDSHNIVALNGGRNRSAILRRAGHEIRPGLERIAVDEIEIDRLRQPGKQARVSPPFDRVKTDMGNLQAGFAGPKPADPPGNPSQAGMLAILVARVGHHLHAKANSENQLTAL